MNNTTNENITEYISQKYKYADANKVGVRYNIRAKITFRTM